MKTQKPNNERFDATAAGSADLKGSAGMPPLMKELIRWMVEQGDIVYSADGVMRSN